MGPDGPFTDNIARGGTDELPDDGDYVPAFADVMSDSRHDLSGLRDTVSAPADGMFD